MGTIIKKLICAYLAAVVILLLYMAALKIRDRILLEHFKERYGEQIERQFTPGAKGRDDEISRALEKLPSGR